jgi:hypothetical protein
VAKLQTKVIVHLPSSKVGQDLTLTPIPLALQCWEPQVWATLQPQTTHTAVSKQSKAHLSRGKIADILIQPNILYSLPPFPSQYTLLLKKR